MSVSLPVAALRVALALRQGFGAEIRRARDGVCGTVVAGDYERRIKVALHQGWCPEAWAEDMPRPRPGSHSGVRAQHLREAEAIEAWALPQITAHQRQEYRVRAAEVDAEADAAWRRRGKARRAARRRKVPAPLFLETA